jgi:hypothetical protein
LSVLSTDFVCSLFLFHKSNPPLAPPLPSRSGFGLWSSKSTYGRRRRQSKARRKTFMPALFAINHCTFEPLPRCAF